MAVIAKVTNTKSAHAALAYALGDGKARLKNDTLDWLESRGIDTSTITRRAVVMSGTNGIVPELASSQMKAVRVAFDQDKQQNQALRIIQSFDASELEAGNPADWQKANEIGHFLAEELYPDYQAAIYTHLDGENHTLHNHIIVSKVNLSTGRKMRQKPGESVKTARAKNDEISQQMGWQILERPKEAVNRSESVLEQKTGFSWRKEIKARVDALMAYESVSSWDMFVEKLGEHKIEPVIRGKNITYVIDAPNGQHRVRGKKLGTDYELETITHELERQNEQQRWASEYAERTNKQADASIAHSRRMEPTVEAGVELRQRRQRAITDNQQRVTTSQSAITSGKQATASLGERLSRFADKLRETSQRVNAFVARARSVFSNTVEQLGDILSEPEPDSEAVQKEQDLADFSSFLKNANQLLDVALDNQRRKADATRRQQQEKLRREQARNKNNGFNRGGGIHR